MVSGQGRRGLIRDANADGKDVAAAAGRLKTPLTDHAVVAQRVEAAVGQIDAALARLNRGRSGVLQSSLQGSTHGGCRSGARLMNYGVALRRPRQAVAGAAANGGQCTRSLMLSVFADGER